MGLKPNRHRRKNETSTVPASPGSTPPPVAMCKPQLAQHCWYVGASVTCPKSILDRSRPPAVILRLHSAWTSFSSGTRSSEAAVVSAGPGTTSTLSAVLRRYWMLPSHRTADSSENISSCDQGQWGVAPASSRLNLNKCSSYGSAVRPAASSTAFWLLPWSACLQSENNILHQRQQRRNSQLGAPARRHQCPRRTWSA